MQKYFAASVLSDQAAITSAQLQLSYTTINSPISGRTGGMLVYPGNIIKTASNTELVTITQVNPVYVLFFSSSTIFWIYSSATKCISRSCAAITLGHHVEKGSLFFINNYY